MLWTAIRPLANEFNQNIRNEIILETRANIFFKLIYYIFLFSFLAFLHGFLPKLGHKGVYSPRRRSSTSVIPVSPLARTPSTSGSSVRSPSPLAVKPNKTLLSPTNSHGRSRTAGSSPLLRRALSPDRLNRNDSAENQLVADPRKLMRSQSMKESKRKKHKYMR